MVEDMTKERPEQKNEVDEIIKYSFIKIAQTFDKQIVASESYFLMIHTQFIFLL